MKMDYNPEHVDLANVPARQNIHGKTLWWQRFNEIPNGKAVMLRYNSRQRAHQVRDGIRAAAKYWNIPISTRIIHGELEIHDTNEWLVYYWKRLENPAGRE